MQNLKEKVSVLFNIVTTIIVAGCLAVPLSFAENHPDQAQQPQNQSVEDLIAIAQAGKQNEAINDAVLGNEAINDAVLGNEAIRENLPQLGEASDQDSEAQQNNTGSSVETTPRQSTAQSVDSDKLILNSPVVDQAQIFNAQEKQMLTQRLRNIYDQGLAQAALVTVPTTNGMDIFQYSLAVAEKWKLGEADTDDGLLILVSVNDRNMYILSGYGLEGVLPDAALNRIIDTEITPSFKQGDYAGGLIKGINRIEERLLADPEVLAQSDALAKERAQGQASGSDSPSIFGLFIISLIGGMFITSVLGRILGSLIATGGFAVLSLTSGGSLIMTIFMAVFLWVFLSSRGGSSGGKGGRGGRGGGGIVFVPGGGFGGGGSGGFGGGGFGGGGFGGGGGGFGGGGAGGSW